MSHELLEPLLKKLDQIILGNPRATRLAVACLLARGHLLIEDIPGVGKTTLAHALADLFGLPFKRIQFTSDLLPGDILGLTLFDVEKNKFRFKRGPIFTSTLLVDEINRATPKTQSALLQAMEEQQVSVEGAQIDLPDPFFVIATQNPLEQSGTFPLPESQLDRFLLRISLGYPSDEHEKHLLTKTTSKSILPQPAMLDAKQRAALMEAVDTVYTSPALIDYLQTLLKETRRSGKFVTGLSPRAGQQWLRAAKAWAVLDDREMVLPDDIKELAPYAACHRLHCSDGSQPQTHVQVILDQVEVL